MTPRPTPTSAPTRRRPRPVAGSGRAAEAAALRRLWDLQREHAGRLGGLGEGMAYVGSSFAMGLTLERRLRVVDMVEPYVRGRVLEWGCRHGLDSCVYRMRLGARVELHGCDVCGPDEYRPFHDFSGLRYRQLRHPFRLEYPDAFFDVVTSDGVLEHVPDDSASLGELFRVLRPGGTLVVTCLPNRYSYTEALQRWRGANAHDRLYTLGSARALLRARGFAVTDTRRFFMVPTMLHGLPAPVRTLYQNSGRAVWAANALLERAWPLSLLSSNLMLVAHKPAGGEPAPETPAP